MLIFDKQASVLVPSIFIAHDPHIPSLQERLKVRVGSIWFLISMRASSTMGPHLSRSSVYSCCLGAIPGVSGFHLYTEKRLLRGAGVVAAAAVLNLLDGVKNPRSSRGNWFIGYLQ